MDLKSRFEKLEFQGSIEFNAPLAKISYYQIGGPAQVLVTPKSFDDLKKIHEILHETHAPFLIVGFGSNLLFRDEVEPRIVIRMKQLFTEIGVLDEGGLERENLRGPALKVGASVGGSTLLRLAAQKGYGGLAHFTGIPGSIGGMVAMNAGTHLGEMKDCVLKTGFVNLNDRELVIKERVHVPTDFTYRHNHFLSPGDLITHVFLKYTPSSPLEVKTQIDELYARRKATQPVDYPSCGSVFVNPKAQGLHSWQVIDQLGLRGHRIGNAQISEKHCNFIINLGGAKASDVRALIDLVQTRAKNELGIELETEVKIFS